IAAARDAFLASLSPRTAARVTGVYRHFPLVALQGDAASPAELAANRLVVAVHEDRLRRPYMRSSLAYMGASSWHGEGHVGAGTSVAVLDTGIRYWNGRFGTCETPGAEGCRVLAFEGFARLRGGTGTTDPRTIAESEPHGTNVGGIVAEVAPGTGLLSLTVFALYDPDPSSGFGGGVLASDGDVVRALDWAVDHQVEYGIVAANMSLGSEVDSDARGYCTGWLAGAFPTAFANCRDAGILPVVATGNEYSKTAVSSPACVAAAVRVGAGYDDPAFGYGCGTGPVVPGAVVCFSNSNALVDLIAPGYDIDAGGLYGYSGTSMAAPHAAGLAAAYQARYGTDPIWTLQRMRVDAVPVVEAYREQPYVHRFVRTGDHDAVLRFDAGVVLASSFRGIFIPDGDPAGIEVSAEVICDVEACASDSVGRVYVDLAVDHWNNDDLAIELEAPDETVARHDVAGNAEMGRYGLNSILGSQHLPGAFDALRLKPIAGVWKLRVRDETPGNTGSLHRAVLLVDSARVLLDAGLDAPRIARPGRAFPVRVTMVNAGNMDIAAAPLRLEMADRAGGAVAVTIPFEVDTPIAPGERLEVELEVIGTRQGEFELRVATSGLDPALPPGLRSESRRVFVTDRTFAAFAVDPALPAPGTPATLVDLSVGLVGSHRWDFGDDATSTDASPAHSWAVEGEYVVTLTVTGPDGASTAAQRVLVVEPPALSAIGSGCECRAP
ncbi:MAG: S8 family serine peptidase, partial [Myxococcota bacterium]|nr:S8 family serine peptidase [Myxococcota bacterium]